MARGTIPTNIANYPPRKQIRWILDYLAGAYNATKSPEWVSKQLQILEVPFNCATTTLTSETEMGFNLPDPGVVLDCWMHVVTIDATEDMSCGVLGTGTGFLANALMGTAGVIKGTLLSTGQTKGTLLRADESGAGVLVPEVHVIHGTATSVTLTASAGSDTGAGSVFILYAAL